MRKIEKSEVLRLIAGLQFREFTNMDRIAFQGCESENPMICEQEDHVVILDGDVICFLNLDEGEEQTFELKQIV